MKNLILFLPTLILVFFACKSGDKNETSSIVEIDNKVYKESNISGWDEYGLKGEVKQFTITSIPVKKVNYEWKETGEETYGIKVFFNTNGSISTILRYWYGMNDLGQREVYQYLDGNLKEIIVYQDETDEKIIGKYIIDECKPILMRTKTETIDDTGEVYRKSNFTWNNGRITEMIMTDFERNYKTEYSYQYDDNNRKINEKVIQYGKDEVPKILTSYANYEYLIVDDRGNWTQRVFEDRKEELNSQSGIKENRIIEYF